MRHLARAISLLTIIPVRSSWDDAELGRAMAAFPLVGGLIGASTLGAAWLLTLPFVPARAGLLASVLVLAVSEVLTGLLHLDGWADCCDALLPPLDRERRLAVMKDPRLGAFGVAGVVLLLLAKLGAVASILAPGAGPRALLPLLVAPVLGRFAPVAGAALLPLAQAEGMAASFRRGLEPPGIAIAALTAAAASALLGWRGAACAAASLLAAAVVGRLAYLRIGGATGDVYGAMVELSETAALVTAALLQE